MRVSFNYDLIVGSYQLLVGGSMALIAAPVAALVGITGHPDAFFISLGALLIAAALGSSIWLFMFICELVRLGATMGVLLLHRTFVWCRRSCRRADAA
jgi:hypothetical protein